MVSTTKYGSLFLIFLLGLFPTCIGQSYQDLYNLQQKLLSNYSRNLRPVLNQSNLLIVKPDFELINLVEVDEIKQLMVINGFLSLSWKDEILTWDPIAYNGIRYLAPESTLVWKPRMVLINTMGERDLFEDNYSPITIEYDGQVLWSPGSLFPSLCRLNLRKFPFDEHICSLYMAPMYLNASDMAFDMTSSSVTFNLYIANGEWDITRAFIHAANVNASYDIYYNALQIEIKIKRKPIFFIINIFFPVLFLSALNIMTFAIPTDEGEKIGFSINILLSMSVYMGIVGAYLPPSSENMPFATYYVFFLFAMSVVSCGATILITWLHKKEQSVERKQKRETKLQNVFSKLKTLNVIKQHKQSSNVCKIHPEAPNAGICSTDLETRNEHSNQTEMTSSDLDSSTTDKIDDSRYAKAQEFILKMTAGNGCKIPPPVLDEAEENDKAQSNPNPLINSYKNLSDTVNLYSAIIFSVINTVVTIIILLLIMT